MKFVCFLSLLVSFNQNLASSFLPADSGQTQLGSTGSQVERTTSVASGDQNVREENRRVNSHHAHFYCARDTHSATH
jgi:hypothetical protein